MKPLTLLLILKKINKKKLFVEFIYHFRNIYKFFTQHNFDKNIRLYNSSLLKYGYTTLVEAGVMNDVEKFKTIEKYINNLCAVIIGLHMIMEK